MYLVFIIRVAVGGGGGGVNFFYYDGRVGWMEWLWGYIFNWGGCNFWSTVVWGLICAIVFVVLWWLYLAHVFNVVGSNLAGSGVTMTIVVRSCGCCRY